jgi:hypothetical protein
MSNFGDLRYTAWEGLPLVYPARWWAVSESAGCLKRICCWLRWAHS